MTEEEKQALIEAAHKWIEVMHRYIDNHQQDISATITLRLYEIALAALTAQPDDTERMNWLASKTVNVRQPLRYGSRDLFWSEAVTDEEDDHHATLLREQIDAAIKGEVQE